MLSALELKELSSSFVNFLRIWLKWCKITLLGRVKREVRKLHHDICKQICVGFLCFVMIYF